MIGDTTEDEVPMVSIGSLSTEREKHLKLASESPAVVGVNGSSPPRVQTRLVFQVVQRVLRRVSQNVERGGLRKQLHCLHLMIEWQHEMCGCDNFKIAHTSVGDE